ncbi:MAG: hypothetical protein IT436_10510 [Phycisphaerales bacterium]|nr:hypothetical protein [Phycisphaerales bacterium]
MPRSAKLNWGRGRPARAVFLSLLFTATFALAQPPTPEPPTPDTPPSFPHLRIDRDSKTIELDGIIPIDPHAKPSTKVYLEVFVCTPDSKEHEALILTKAKASHLHAALLMLGLQPGQPGAFEWKDNQLTSTPPAGPALDITFIYTDKDGKEVQARPADWVLIESTGQHLSDSDPPGQFLFAGSKFITTDTGERYRADTDGTLIGLTTFGTETIAWSQVLSPQADIQPPDWIADRTRVPPYNTPVKIRIRPLTASAAPTPQPPTPDSPAPK